MVNEYKKCEKAEEYRGKNLTRQWKHYVNDGPTEDNFLNCLCRLWNINTCRAAEQYLILAVQRNQFNKQQIFIAFNCTSDMSLVNNVTA